MLDPPVTKNLEDMTLREALVTLVGDAATHLAPAHTPWLWAEGRHALVFPGQGSQFIGMARRLAGDPMAFDVLGEADEVLGDSLSSLMRDGPEEELMLTRNAQPAILAASWALLAVLKGNVVFLHGASQDPSLTAQKDMPQIVTDAVYVLGHSLGEYTALVAAGALPFSDAIRLVRARGDAMQAACMGQDVGMMALYPCTSDQARALVEDVRGDLAEHEVCDIANINSPSQVVISGTRRGMDTARQMARGHGIKRCIPLPVSCAFHSRLMHRAEAPLKTALDTTKLLKPAVPLVSNVTATETSDVATIRSLLVKHISASVLWAESIRYCHDNGVARFIEIGTKPVLSSLTQQIIPDASVSKITSVDEVGAFLAQEQGRVS